MFYFLTKSSNSKQKMSTIAAIITSFTYTSKSSTELWIWWRHLKIQIKYTNTVDDWHYDECFCCCQPWPRLHFYWRNRIDRDCGEVELAKRTGINRWWGARKLDIYRSIFRTVKAIWYTDTFTNRIRIVYCVCWSNAPGSTCFSSKSKRRRL